MTDTLIKINNIEEARKWVGRTARTGYGYKTSTAPLRLRDSSRLLAAPSEHPCGAPGFVFGGYIGGREQSDGAVWIELTDGPAHPRPEGEGWEWFQYAGRAAARFGGKRCEIDAAPWGDGPALTGVADIKNAVGGFLNCDNPDNSGIGGCVSFGTRGGAWIREIPCDTFDPVAVAEAAADLAAEEAKAAKAARDAADQEYAAAQLRAETALDCARNAKAEADTERKAREEEDARFPLPEGYHWTEYGFASNVEGSAYIDDEGDLVLDHGSAEVALGLPLPVVRAILARYDAQSTPQEAWTLKDKPHAMREVSHTLAVGDRVRVECGDSVSEHKVQEVDYAGDVFVDPPLPWRERSRGLLYTLDAAVKVTKLT